MNNNVKQAGRAELRQARSESRGLYWAVAVFSIFTNLLMLTGPLYMLQIYDRVLGSRSEATLIALTLVVVFLYGMMGLMDFVRGRIMSRVGARFQARLDRRVFDAVLRKSVRTPSKTGLTGLTDLEAVQRFMTSPVFLSIFDIPWTPIFLLGIALFHPWLGMLAVAGGSVLILAIILNQALSRRPLMQAMMASNQSQSTSGQLQTEAEMVRALGMTEAGFARWQQARNKALHEQVSASDLGGTFTSFTKTFRLFLQSAMLGLGAYLVLQNELTPGAMIAGSILLGRALAPIEVAVGQWPVVERALRGWDALAELLGEVPEETPRTKLPKPAAKLEVQQLTVLPPGESQASLRVVSFAVAPGQAVGVIGPSGSGKSTLARAITGVWPPAGGRVRLDGASLDQYEPEDLGRYIGYLPQRVQLFNGTIADNIARLSLQPDHQKVVAAAKKAAAHDMIVALPNGYDTVVSSADGRLSGGQIQRIGLARALYSEPVILVLDEPNSNLDSIGSEALNSAIRTLKSEGSSILIMAHRPAAIQECDLILVLEGGTTRKFGPRDEVLREVLANAEQVRKATARGAR
ncbi:type I secretion system permease/ATPase [Shimia biformata]|uniref:type I secretion system permease/ATPase n=1 Tax=Shimia biformata TaxID=1294299 RepID=UPI00194E7870|nr:type I secretion system permease/ATPase [Shimia biformata]